MTWASTWSETIGAKFGPRMYDPYVASRVGIVASLFRQLPGRTLDGHYGIHFNQEALDLADEMGFNGMCADTTKITMDPTEVTVDLQAFSLSTELCVQSRQFNSIVDQSQAQINNLLRRTGRAFEWQVINGSGATGKPKGLKSWVSNVTDNGGAALTLNAVDRLLDSVVVGRENVVLVGNESMKRKLESLARTYYSQGMVIDITLPGGYKYPSFKGIPFIASNFVMSNEGTLSNTTSLYAVSLAEGEGLEAIFGEPLDLPQQIAAPGVSAPFQIIRTQIATGSSKFGYNIYAAANFALHSPQAASRISNILVDA
jgi:hypothetical protein